MLMIPTGFLLLLTKPAASVHDGILNRPQIAAEKKYSRVAQALLIQSHWEKLMKSILQNSNLDSNPSSTIPPQRTFHFTSPDQTTDEPHAVFALGNFFGDGDIFVKIPWQSLQLTKPSKSLNIDIGPAETISREFGRSNEASLEIKRDASGCIQIIARKNPSKQIPG
jgi:hypothetical protein